jgi:indole-3-glycerol phosphate synthase
MMLEPILAATRQRVEAMQSLRHYRDRAGEGGDVRPFPAALAGEHLAVIAEVKRRSPSRGVLAQDLDPAAQAARYASGGAACISVLTEPDFFSGSDSDLIAVRAACPLPVLRKDFTLDPRQIWEARAIGADAILLIVAALDDSTLSRLHATSLEAGMAALVEVHTAAEAERALAMEATLVGVNNRNLDTFVVDLATSEHLADLLAGVPVKVAESGIHRPQDAARMQAAGFDAVLVGEALVTAVDPSALIAELRGNS